MAQRYCPYIKAGDLAVYPTHRIYAGGFKHLPLNVAALRDAMPLLFELLSMEPKASVRQIGALHFGKYSSYMDGNRPADRFMMNGMLSSWGYLWTIIPVGKRADYMSCLEAASITGDIIRFAKFIAKLVRLGMEGKSAPKLKNIK